MAEDYLTDDEQWEAVKRWLAENGLWIIAGVVLGAGLLFGWRFYENHREIQALEAAGRFGEMTTALEINDKNKSRAIANGLIKDFPGSPYADQARLTLARLAVDDGQLAGAVAPLTAVMNDSKDKELRHIARLRLARVMIADGKPDEALQTLADDDAAKAATGGVVTLGPFSSRSHEVRGDAFFAKKDAANAAKEYQMALIGDGGADAALLELKIADLGAPAVPAMTTIPTTAPAATSSNKAKP